MEPMGRVSGFRSLGFGGFGFWGLRKLESLKKQQGLGFRVE